MEVASAAIFQLKKKRTGEEEERERERKIFFIGQRPSKVFFFSFSCSSLTLHVSPSSQRSSYDTRPLPGGAGGAASEAERAAAAAAAAAIARASTGGGGGGRR
jgi:hypothetical protein